MQKQLSIYLLLCVIGSCNHLTVIGQDLHFSQTSYAAMFYNPAQTGNFPQHWRGSLLHRNQAYSLDHPYITEMASFEHQLYWGINRFSIGGWLANDQAGIAQLNSTLTNVSAACHPQLGAYNLHIGGGLSFTHRSLNPSKLSFPDQFDISTGQFNPGMATQEPIYKDRHNYLSLNFGAIIQRSFSEKRSLSAGLAAHHLNRPTVGFTQNRTQRPIAWQAHLQMHFYAANTKSYISPLLHYYRAGQQSEALIGSEFALNTTANSSKLDQIKAGLLLRTGPNRNTDAFVITTAFSFSRFTFGLSTDFNLTQLNGKTFTPATYEAILSYNGPIFRLTDQQHTCPIW